MFSFYREREAIWRSTRGDRWQQKWVVFFKKAAASRPAQNLTTTSSHGHYITSKPAERIGRKRNKKVVVNRLESTKPSTRFSDGDARVPVFLYSRSRMALRCSNGVYAALQNEISPGTLVSSSCCIVTLAD